MSKNTNETEKEVKTNSVDLKSIQDALSQKFPAGDVKQRDAGFGGKKLDYISIDVAINRLNEVLPLGYDWTVDNTQVINDAVVVTGTLSIEINGKIIKRSGVGADSLGKDMDKAIKTAYAEAFKKAGNTLGIALYLWDADERADLARERQAATVSDKRTFTSVQLEKMKNIRKKLGLDTDEKLNTYLTRTYNNPSIKTKADFNPNNIDAFFKFVDELKK